MAMASMDYSLASARATREAFRRAILDLYEQARKYEAEGNEAAAKTLRHEADRLHVKYLHAD